MPGGGREFPPGGNRKVMLRREIEEAFPEDGAHGR